MFSGFNSKLGRIGLKGTWKLRHYFCEYLCDGLNHSDYFAFSMPYIYMTLLLFISHT